MQCVKCKATWESKDLTNCPYCQALVTQQVDENDDDVLIYEIKNKVELSNTNENEYQKLNKLMTLITENYTEEIYLEQSRFSAIVKDLFPKTQILEDIKQVIALGITLDIYDIYQNSNDIELEYYDLIDYVCKELTMEKEIAIPLISLLFYGLNIDCSEYDQYVEPVDMASEVLNSVLNKTVEPDDFASSILDFVNNDYE